MVKMYDKFVCMSCEKTSVIRPQDCDRDTPKCTACSEATGGVSEMTWVESLTEDELDYESKIEE